MKGEREAQDDHRIAAHIECAARRREEKQEEEAEGGRRRRQGELLRV